MNEGMDELSDWYLMIERMNKYKYTSMCLDICKQRER